MLRLRSFFSSLAVCIRVRNRVKARKYVLKARNISTRWSNCWIIGIDQRCHQTLADVLGSFCATGQSQYYLLSLYKKNRAWSEVLSHIQQLTSAEWTPKSTSAAWAMDFAQAARIINCLDVNYLSDGCVCLALGRRALHSGETWH